MDSSATPVAKAAAEAACPDGNDVVTGCRLSCRTDGTRSSIGRSRRTAPLPTVLIATDATASEAAPRNAARRERALPPRAAIPAAVPNQSSPWLALRLSLGSSGSAPGQCRSATLRKTARSRLCSQPRNRAVAVEVADEVLGVDMDQRIPGRAPLNQEAR